MRSAICLALLVGWVGCTSPNPKSCLDHHCSDPALPFCDEDGSIGGTPGTCIAVGCTANMFEECRGDLALTCNATGDDYLMVDCPYGCGATGCLPCNTAACEKHIIPKYLPAVCDTISALPPMVISSDTTIDTSDASMCTSVASQTSGPEICVVRAPTISIAAQTTLKVVGTRGFALVADRQLAVEGVLDASADTTTNGPGGGILKSGTGSAVGGPGGGGPGARTPGGAGGSDAGDGAAANGGPMGTSPTLVVSLVGGSQPAVVDSLARPPGGGGGAVTLISCRGLITISGTLDVGGGGGLGDRIVIAGPQINHYPAAGGGSGGTLVLQGMAITVSGGIFANGGGGGAGGASAAGGVKGNPGTDALRSSMSAPGGTPNTNGGGSGGQGGSLNFPGPGERPLGSSDCGIGCGAGGGGAGFVLTQTPAGSPPALGTATVSPGFETNVTIPTN